MGLLPLSEVIFPARFFLVLLKCLLPGVRFSIAVLVAFSHILLFELFPFPPHPVFIPAVNFCASAAIDSPHSEMCFAYHSFLPDSRDYTVFLPYKQEGCVFCRVRKIVLRVDRMRCRVKIAVSL